MTVLSPVGGVWPPEGSLANTVGAMQPTVLVTDADQRAAVTVMRSLHRAGYRTIGDSVRRSAAGRWSSACDAGVTVPAPAAGPGYVGALADALRGAMTPMSVATTDASLEALARCRAILGERRQPVRWPRHVG